jgi:hypothetical protein
LEDRTLDAQHDMAWLPDEAGEQALRDWLHDMHVYSPQAWLRASLALLESMINIEQNGLEQHTGLHVCRVVRATARAVSGRRPSESPRPPTKNQARTWERWSEDMAAASQLLDYPPMGQEAEREVTDAAAALLNLLYTESTQTRSPWTPASHLERDWGYVTGVLNVMVELRGWERCVYESAVTTVQAELVPWVLGEESPLVKRAADLRPNANKWQDAWCRWGRTLAGMQDELEGDDPAEMDWGDE